MGYKGLKHIGGKVVGSPLGEHNVVVLFQDPYTLKFDALKDISKIPQQIERTGIPSVPTRRPPQVPPQYRRQEIVQPDQIPEQLRPVHPPVSRGTPAVTQKSGVIPETFPEMTITDKANAAWQTAQREATIASQEAVARATGKGQKIKEGTEELLFQKELPKKYKERLKEQGIAPETREEVSKWRDAINATDDFQAKTGEDIGGFTQRLIESSYKRRWLEKDLKKAVNFKKPMKQLKKQGISNDDVTYLAHYYESTPQGVVFNPNALKIPGKVDIEPFNFKAFSPEKLEAIDPTMKQIRQNLDSLHGIAAESGDIGYLSRYVPIKSKIPMTTAFSKEKVINPSIYHKRISGVEGDLVETDFGKLVDRYYSELTKKQAFEEPLREALDLQMRFKARGMNQASSYIEKLVNKATGTKSAKEANFLTRDFIMAQSEKEMKVLMKGMDRGLKKQLYDETAKAVYQAWVAMNPELLAVQSLQPELVAAADVGLSRILKARLTKTVSKKSKQMVKEVKERLYPPEYDILELGEKAKTDKFAKVYGQILQTPSQPFMWWLKESDRIGRETLFLAGRSRYLSNQSKAMKNILESEKQIVLNSLRSKGKEAAAREYGIIMARKHMDTFSPINLPDAMKNPVGESIKFTTFFRSRANDFTSALKNKQYGRLGKQAIYQTANALALNAIVGHFFGEESGKSVALKSMPWNVGGQLTGAKPFTIPTSLLQRIGQGTTIKDPFKGITRSLSSSIPAGKIFKLLSPNKKRRGTIR